MLFAKNINMKFPEDIFFLPEEARLLKKPTLAIALSAVSAGFPSPADDFLDRDIVLEDYLVRNRAATFLIRVRGASMEGCGICDGDIVVVDRSLTAASGKVVLAAVDGEFTLKRLLKKGTEVWLAPENPAFSPMRIGPDTVFQVWGVATFCIRHLQKQPS